MNHQNYFHLYRVKRKTNQLKKKTYLFGRLPRVYYYYANPCLYSSIFFCNITALTVRGYTNMYRLYSLQKYIGIRLYIRALLCTHIHIAYYTYTILWVRRPHHRNVFFISRYKFTLAINPFVVIVPTITRERYSKIYT